MPKRHVLKCETEQFRSVSNGHKTSEIRKNDRGFQVGDLVELRCFDRSLNKYTGEIVFFTISHLLEKSDYGMQVGFCAISFSKIIYFLDSSIAGHKVYDLPDVSDRDRNEQIGRNFEGIAQVVENQRLTNKQAQSLDVSKKDEPREWPGVQEMDHRFDEKYRKNG